MKNLSKFLAIIVIGTVIGFSLMGCDDGNGGGNGGNNGGGTTSYTVSFDAGNGDGTPPASQTVNAGSSITLPGKGDMTAPTGQSFNGWRTGGQNYAAGDSYTVNGNVTFIAQWTTGGGGGGDDTIPSVPTGVTATTQSSSSISVSWSAVSGATSYKVYYEIGSSSTKNLADEVTGTSYTHTSLTASTTYYYYIKAVNGAGESGYSSFDSATTSSSGGGGGGNTIPSTPTGVTATPSSSGITISWTAVTGATSYKVYAPNDPGYSSNFELLDTVTTNSYFDDYPLAGETWYYKVSAVNSAGESAQSSAVSAKMAEAAAVYTIDKALFNTSTTKKSGSTLVFNWTLKTSGKTPNGLYTYKAPDSIEIAIQSGGSYVTVQTLAGSARTYTLNNYAAYVEDDRVYLRITCVSTSGNKISYAVYRPLSDSFSFNYP
jgi:hypothetical protein